VGPTIFLEFSHDRRALVTGGASGFGPGVVDRLVAVRGHHAPTSMQKALAVIVERHPGDVV
jgi:NAD(P)-dependent dehydrogenase (short-subunit alcohol dehydrogenase family)